MLDDEDDYVDDIKDELRFLTSSKVRIELLTYLHNKPSTLKDLHEKTQLNYSSITSNINKLEEYGYVYATNEYYNLTTTAKIKLINILYLNNNIEFLYEYVDFFNNHHVENDNIKALSTLPFISSSRLIQAGNINPYLATETIEETMMREGRVRSICIYLHPNCSGMIEVMMNQKSDFWVIVPSGFDEYIITHANNYKTDTPLKNINFNVKTLTDATLNIALVVSEKEIVVGLVRKDGLFNKNCVLRSEDGSAIKWGLSVFKEFEKLKDGYISVRDIVSKNNNLE